MGSRTGCAGSIRTSGARAVSLVVPGDAGHAAPAAMPTTGRSSTSCAPRGWQVDVHTLGGGFPHPDRGGAGRRRGAARRLARRRAGAAATGWPSAPCPVWPSVTRRGSALVALVHHPLAAETGLAPAEAASAVRERAPGAGDHARRRGDQPRHGGATGRLRRGRRADRGRDARHRAGASGARHARVEPRGRGSAAVRRLAGAAKGPRRCSSRPASSLRELPWRLTCVGSLDLDPPTAREVRDLAGARGFETRIAFPGPVRSADLGWVLRRRRCVRAADLLRRLRNGGGRSRRPRAAGGRHPHRRPARAGRRAKRRAGAAGRPRGPDAGPRRRHRRRRSTRAAGRGRPRRAPPPCPPGRRPRRRWNPPSSQPGSRGALQR